MIGVSIISVLGHHRHPVAVGIPPPSQIIADLMIGVGFICDTKLSFLLPSKKKRCLKIEPLVLIVFRAPRDVGTIGWHENRNCVFFPQPPKSPYFSELNFTETYEIVEQYLYLAGPK